MLKEDLKRLSERTTRAMTLDKENQQLNWLSIIEFNAGSKYPSHRNQIEVSHIQGQDRTTAVLHELRVSGSAAKAIRDVEGTLNIHLPNTEAPLFLTGGAARDVGVLPDETAATG